MEEHFKVISETEEEDGSLLIKMEVDEETMNVLRKIYGTDDPDIISERFSAQFNKYMEDLIKEKEDI